MPRRRRHRGRRARGRAGFSKLPTEALQCGAQSYLQRPLLPPSARRTIKPPTTSMTKPQKAFDTISSPSASRTNTAPPMNNSVPHTSPDWRYSIRAATSPPSPPTGPGGHFQPKHPEEHQGSGDKQEYAEEGTQSDFKS